MHPRVILNRLENHRSGQKKRIYNRTFWPIFDTIEEISNINGNLFTASFLFIKRSVGYSR